MPTDSIIDLSYYLIAKAHEKGDVITNKKLQKLLYFVNAWYLAYFDKPITDEEPQAWRMGPVYPTSYHTFKSFAYNPITMDDKYKDKEPEKFITSLLAQLDLKEDQVELLNAVLLKYGSLSAYQLEVLTHQDEPWLTAREGLSEFDNSKNNISYAEVDDVYKKKLSNIRASSKS